MPPKSVTIPTEVETIGAASSAILPGVWYAQAKAFDKNWTVFKIVKTPKGVGTFEFKYYRSEYYDGRTGKSYVKDALFGTDLVSPTNLSLAATAAKGKWYKAAQKLLENVVTDDGTPPEDAETTLNNTPIPVEELDGVNWNPPPHAITRPPSFYTLANISKDFIISSNAQTGAVAAALSAQQAAKNITKLGKIYQNKSSAAALNRKKGLTEANAKASDLWGFRFTYNPTRISYGSTIDTAIDWMLQPKDPSNFFGGNTVITFDLYLNRIADMSALKNPKANLATAYPGKALTDTEKNGILKRGTEYDLEFLYRVVNGRPGGTSLVSDTSLLTSDYGYITGMPVWLQFHENMRYRGSLSSIQVEHVIFTENMIPMLTVVKLAFIRYPELDKLTKKARKDIEAQLDTNANTSSTTDK